MSEQADKHKLLRSSLIPDWRYKEIASIADATAIRASYCLIGRQTAIAEKRFLKRNSHIRFLTDPTLDICEAKLSSVTPRKLVRKDGKKADYYDICIYFNGDAGTINRWNLTLRNLFRVLGEVLFFSEAANIDDSLKESLEQVDREKYLNDFVDEIIKNNPYYHPLYRPRFTLAGLHQIIDDDEQMSQRKNHLLPYLQRILYPYLGPDASMSYLPMFESETEIARKEKKE